MSHSSKRFTVHKASVHLTCPVVHVSVEIWPIHDLRNLQFISFCPCYCRNLSHSSKKVTVHKLLSSSHFQLSMSLSKCTPFIKESYSSLLFCPAHINFVHVTVENFCPIHYRMRLFTVQQTRHKRDNSMDGTIVACTGTI